MDGINIAYSAGIIMGVSVVAIVFTLLKGKRKVWEYDERQMLARGKSFKYGFLTLIIYNILYGALASEEMMTWIDNFTANVIGVGIGLTVFAICCILNDAYMALNERPKSIYLILTFGGLGNLIIGSVNFHGYEEVDFSNSRIINLCCGVMLILLLLVFWIKNKKDGSAAE